MNNENNAAFYYIAEGYQTQGKTLMGRQSAGEGFIKGFAKHAGVTNFYCYGPNVNHFDHFRRTILEASGKEQGCIFIPFEQLSRLGDVGCVFFPGPDFSNEAWVRRSMNPRSYSFCGITHTTATERVMDSIGSLLINPVESWDAIVCTSSVVKKTLERVLDSYGDYLEDRTHVRPKMPVQLPIIPLGVDCNQFNAAEKEKYRDFWREKLGIGQEDIAVLYMGRLSFNAKAHPLPMFLALEEAVRRTKKKVHLILAGWFDPHSTEPIWQQDVQKFCPSVQVDFLDGRQIDVRREIWSAADIFTSLSDNVQETFGLTPIEAMAASLPVVVTDWDGYRDTVRHGIDGFRVPVWMPEPGAGEDIALRFANKVDSYGRYCGTVSQMTSVDIGACVYAYVKLIEDQELRLRMGQAGRGRALAEYDWSRVVTQYQGLWQELSQRRIRDEEIAPFKRGRDSMPLRMDPFRLFQEYPTDHIRGDSLVILQVGKVQVWKERVSSSFMNNFASSLLLSEKEQTILMEYLTQYKRATVSDLMKLFPKEQEVVLKRTIGWMGKVGMIAICGPQNFEIV